MRRTLLIAMLSLGACSSGLDAPTAPAQPEERQLPAPARVVAGPMVHVCPDQFPRTPTGSAGSPDTASAAAEAACQPMMAVASSVTVDTADSGPALVCLPGALVRGQVVRCAMRWSRWEVLAWRFAEDRSPSGWGQRTETWERSGLKEWTGVAGVSGVVTVFIRKGNEQRTFGARVIVLNRTR
jgi:hypothetical protein